MACTNGGDFSGEKSTQSKEAKKKKIKNKIFV